MSYSVSMVTGTAPSLMHHASSTYTCMSAGIVSFSRSLCISTSRLPPITQTSRQPALVHLHVSRQSALWTITVYIDLPPTPNHTNLMKASYRTALILKLLFARFPISKLFKLSVVTFCPKCRYFQPNMASEWSLHLPYWSSGRNIIPPNPLSG